MVDDARPAEWLFGLLGFELFSQTRGLVSDHAATFDDTTRTMAEAIGLP